MGGFAVQSVERKEEGAQHTALWCTDVQGDARGDLSPHAHSLWLAREEIQDPAAQVCVEAQVVQLGGQFGGGRVEGAAIIYKIIRT